MSAAALMDIAPAASSRLLADVKELHGRDSDDREPALDRLEAALGRDFADRLVAALSQERIERGDFADRLLAALSQQRVERDR